ncbi:MAG: serine/threonine protein kinase, bacterial, partial [Pseudonocardiales bacterium]|nr:serine/threonine protein kinase, bacterial [Pseudonocardiales bacterium]
MAGDAGEQFGPYVLGPLLGVGGMGEVYRAHDTRRDRVVALKLLPETISVDEEYLARFRREQQIAARLNDPHIVPIHDFGEIDGRLFLDMRLVEGRDVGRILSEDGPLAPARAVHIVSQAAEALDAAHDDRLVHRDIKPSNILVTPKDFAYVADFGIARVLGTARVPVTSTGATVGTLAYMAPERFTQGPVDGRADVYSLACVLHECLTGKPPFAGEDLAALLYAHLQGTPPRAAALAEGVPAALDDVIHRGMAKDPDDRFATAGALAAAAVAALLSEPADTGGGRAPVTVTGTPAPAVPPTDEPVVVPGPVAVPAPADALADAPVPTRAPVPADAPAAVPEPA